MKAVKDRNLYRRNGVWYWREKIGGREFNESLQTGNKELAIRRRDVKRAAAREGNDLVLLGTRVKRTLPTVGQVAAAYEAAAAVYRQFNRGKPASDTVRKNVGCLYKVLKVGLGRDDVDGLGVEVVNAGLVRKYEESMAPDGRTERAAVTIQSTLRQARSVFCRWAVRAYGDEGLTMPPDLAGFMAGGKIRGAQAAYQLPPSELIDRTLAAGTSESRVDIRQVFLLALKVGLRAKEMVFARRQWIREQVGNDGAEFYMEVLRRPAEGFKPKGNEHRVRMRPEVAREILDLAGEEFLLPRDTKTGRMNLVNREFSAWMRGLGWNAETYPKAAHELRKLAGSEWYTRLGPAVAKEWLGHSSIETTVRFYANLKSHPLPPE